MPAQQPRLPQKLLLEAVTGSAGSQPYQPCDSRAKEPASLQPRVFFPALPPQTPPSAHSPPPAAGPLSPPHPTCRSPTRRPQASFPSGRKRSFPSGEPPKSPQTPKSPQKSTKRPPKSPPRTARSLPVSAAAPRRARAVGLLPEVARPRPPGSLIGCRRLLLPGSAVFHWWGGVSRQPPRVT